MLTNIQVNNHAIIVDSILQSQTVSGVVWLPIGSRHEEKLFRGVTHLLEHLISTENVEIKSFNDKVYEIGGRIKSITTPEYTLFGFTVPFEKWQDVMNNLLEHLINLNVPPCLVESERNVILSEKRNIDNDYKRKIHEINILDIFPKNNISHTVIGSIEDIENIELRTIKTYYESYFKTSNFSIVLSGNVNLEEVKKFMEENACYFSNADKKVDRMQSQKMLLDINSRIITHKENSRNIYALGSWVLPKLCPREQICLSILNYYLGGGRNSYAFRKARNAESIFGYGSYSYRTTFSDCAIWSIFTMVQKQCSIEEVVSGIMLFVNSGMQVFFENPDCLDYVSNSLLGSMSISLESTLMRANCIARYWNDNGSLFNFDDIKRCYSSISMNDIEYIYSLFKTSVITILY